MLLKEPKIYLFGSARGVPEEYHPHAHHYIAKHLLRIIVDQSNFLE
jgi:hypothetical protein